MLRLIAATAIAIVFCACLALRLGIWAGIPFFKRLSDRMETRKRNDEKRYPIRFDAERISIVNHRISPPRPINIKWSEIDRLIVFKRDLFAVDLICLSIEFQDGRCLELDEAMDGWEPFIAAMPAYLIGCKKLDEWFSAVASPAFATNPTEIFRREAAME